MAASMARRSAFTLGLSLLTGIVFSLAPALQASSPISSRPSRRHAPLAGGCAAAQSAQSAGRDAGRVVARRADRRGIVRQESASIAGDRPGFEPAKVVTASFDLGPERLRRNARAAVHVRLSSERVAALPGVEAVSLGNIVAFSDRSGSAARPSKAISRSPVRRMAFDFNAIGPNYFHTLGIATRARTRIHGAGHRRRAARHHRQRSHGPPLLARTGWRSANGPVAAKSSASSRNSKEKGLTADPRPTIYLPLLQSYVPELTAARADGDGSADAARRGAPRSPSARSDAAPLQRRTLAEQKDGSLYTERVAAALLTLFGLLALLGGRRRDLRRAVVRRDRAHARDGHPPGAGAQPRDLLALVVGQGMLLTLIGLVSASAPRSP